ncbi:histidinol-phosphate transaminase [Pararhizobium sp. IMCC21322]|uniref:histidinol-phosphate transaminase n=1 Tax=Pararhizobium sp. IMCC21322 TaxID=3067903 RepID=UPI0027406C75|nr:histidinol-phosphate transaminase [Pararhizobium sp. IMCC21322]
MNQLEKILRPTLAHIHPYNSGLGLDEVKSKYGVTEIAKLASNENPAGPAPQVLSGLKLASSDLFLYPDANSVKLATTLADYLDVASDNLIFGNGSEELISIICRSVVQPGDRVITLYPSFPLHEDYATLMGAKVERISLTDALETDLKALLEAVAKPAKMLIFANPMNPVGTWLNPQQLKKVIATKHPDTLLVLDEAYYEYAIEGDYVSGQACLMPGDQNWIILRTFSKAWGLAGLRVGFGICGSKQLRQALDLTRTPFNINAIAQMAATLALQNDGHMKSCTAETIRQRNLMAQELSSRGYRIAPSLGNFVFFDVKRPSMPVAEDLMKRGTIIKPWKQEGYDTFIRVSIGSEQENTKFLTDLDAILPPDHKPPVSV